MHSLKDQDLQEEVEFTRFFCFTAIIMSCISAGLGANFLTNCDCIIILSLIGCSKEEERQGHVHSAKMYPTIRNFPINLSHVAVMIYLCCRTIRFSCRRPLIHGRLDRKKTVEVKRLDTCPHFIKFFDDHFSFFIFHFSFFIFHFSFFFPHFSFIISVKKI
jgi:hypothetical protein